MAKAKLKKRDIQKALKELMFEAAPLSTNRGRLIHHDHCPRRANAKDKRHSGWKTSKWSERGKYQEELANGNDPLYFFDKWKCYNDGFKYDRDKTHIRPLQAIMGNPNSEDAKELEKNNQKLMKQLKIREARKKKKYLENMKKKSL